MIINYNYLYLGNRYFFDNKIDILNINGNQLLGTPLEEKRIFFDTEIDIFNST